MPATEADFERALGCHCAYAAPRGELRGNCADTTISGVHQGGQQQVGTRNSRSISLIVLGDENGTRCDGVTDIDFQNVIPTPTTFLSSGKIAHIPPTSFRVTIGRFHKCGRSLAPQTHSAVPPDLHLPAVGDGTEEVRDSAMLGEESFLKRWEEAGRRYDRG
ncbi:hypothetical protein M427DRAFT_143615 [Gonapodya prolifera JEL478]|uniref:Uncharacterized protein n=1 Tax=Gonapodya prolifera (strain JEL478) TaxID=1344416 RepID=A0A139AQJ6_GONPJ|nr:hypothetical protein M427DRAFT_143615 [Gonapodya prolifera JEL478]|eukprot:KXS18998.1 hypothetical protein M427DRAFT_143615 [Gonapodya prolifera JEL478]